MKRLTIRFNDVEEAELDLLKKMFHLENDSQAVKVAVEWVNHYIKNVSNTFFPPSYDVILSKKMKTKKLDRKIY